MPFGEILPSLGFPWHSTDFSYRAIWVKFHGRPQPVFNRTACFVVKFYCRPRSVQSPLVYRKTPAKNKARRRSTARLLPRRRRAINFKIYLRCFAAKFRRNFTRRGAELRSFIQSRRLLAQNSRDKIYKIYAAFYSFVLSAQHFIAAETMYFRSNSISSPCPAEQALFEFRLEAHF